MTSPEKVIDVAALRHNWAAIRRRSAAKKLLAVVKSNAYGHGRATVVRALAGLADGFAVVEWRDALAVRRQAADAFILLLQGVYGKASLRQLAALRLTPVVHQPQQLAAILSLPSDAGVGVYVKVNTGMNRLGFAPEEVPPVLEALRRHAGIRAVTLMTHFARADVAGGLADALARFAPLRQYGLPVSLGNSAAALLHGDIDDDVARVGIALYGASPAPEWHRREALALRPVMTFRTRLIAVHSFAAGEAVGYGGVFVARRRTRIGVARAGYGDGYPRRLGLRVLCRGVSLPVVGQVSMEMIAVDLGDTPAAVNDEVILWGESPAVDEVATAADTIAYDLLTSVSKLPATVRSAEPD